MKTFLNNKNFRYITISDWFSVLGDSLFFLAFISFAATLKNSEIAITLVTLSETIPDVLSFFAGYLCDKTKNKYNADIYCAFLRAILYLIVGILFMTTTDNIILFSVIAINLVSDFMGNYSDCLRFPEIYAIVDEKEFESSNGFSSGIYYTFSVVGKMIGGIVLLLLHNDYSQVAFVNSFSFVVCGLLLLVVMKDVNKAMAKYETQENDEMEKSFVGQIRKIFSNNDLKRLLTLFAILNALVSSATFIMYIILAEFSTTANSKYSIYLSIIEGISIIGMIFGNILAGSCFGKVSLKVLADMEFVILIATLLSLLTHNIVFITVSFLALYFFHGIISIKFTTYVYSSEKYESLGLSTGIINTVLTITVPLLWLIVSTIGNMSSFKIAIWIMCFISFIIIIIGIFEGNKKV